MKKYILGVVLSVGIFVSPALAEAQTSTLPNGCLPGYLLSTLTGQSCSSTSGLSAGCLAGNLYNTLTGQKCVSIAQTTGGFCHNFNTNLGIGSIGAEVAALKAALFLSTGVLSFTASGVGTHGVSDSANFTKDTVDAVVSFQAKYSILRTGYVGPLTRAKLNALYGCHNGMSYQQGPSTAVAPTASLTVNGSHSISTDNLSLINFVYSSTNGTSWKLNSTNSGCTDASKNGSTSGDASANGTLNGGLSPGCSLAMTYVVSGPAGTASDSVSVTNANPSGPSWSSNPTTPTISSISPAQGGANTTVTINGANLSSASSVQFYNSNNQYSAGLTPSYISPFGGTQIQVLITGIFAANVVPGTYQVKVVTPSGTSNGSNFTLTTP